MIRGESRGFFFIYTLSLGNTGMLQKYIVFIVFKT